MTTLTRGSRESLHLAMSVCRFFRRLLILHFILLLSYIFIHLFSVEAAYRRKKEKKRGYHKGLYKVLSIVHVMYHLLVHHCLPLQNSIQCKSARDIIWSMVVKQT